MTTYVLDANVAAKWLLPANLETHTKEERNVLQDLALTVRLGAQLLTADERLANALASRFPVRWLGVYTSAC